MKKSVIHFIPLLFVTGCCCPCPQVTPGLHKVPAEKLVIRVQVDGQGVGQFEADVLCAGYVNGTGWHASDTNNEVVYTFGQSDFPTQIRVRSMAPSPVFVAATALVQSNTLPASPFIFNLTSAKR